jgi:hypothetical protein
VAKHRRRTGRVQDPDQKGRHVLRWTALEPD